MDDEEQASFQLNDSATRTQYGALCWRMFRDQLQILLVTSRDTGRWVIPKGWPMPGETPEGAALKEAWEEAGVEGRVNATCIGIYSYDKLMGPARAIPCIVAVYPVKVTRLRGSFPESKERRRKWFAADKAAKKVDEPELKSLLAGFAPSRAKDVTLPLPPSEAPSG